MAGLADAEHEETAPEALTLVISRLSCSLAGDTRKIKLSWGSRVHRAYQKEEAVEAFTCNYGLNPGFRGSLEKGPLNVVGVDLDGEVRAIELSGHPFFVGTLYQPQLSSTPDRPHPLVVAFLKAAAAFRASDHGRTNRA